MNLLYGYCDQSRRRSTQAVRCGSLLAFLLILASTVTVEVTFGASNNNANNNENNNDNNSNNNNNENNNAKQTSSSKNKALKKAKAEKVNNNEVGANPNTAVSPPADMGMPDLEAPPAEEAPLVAPDPGPIQSTVLPETQAAEPPKAPDLPPPNEFGGAPPVPGTRRIMAIGEAPEEYVVERGDTLYDISDQLIDERGYWPKLWAMNPEIKNPHFIYPGMRLRFYPGDRNTPPYLQIVHEDDVVPVDKGSLSEAQLVSEELIEIKEEPLEVTEVIGPEDLEVPAEIIADITEGGRIYNGKEIKFEVPGFIYEEELEPLGQVVTGHDGESQLGAGEEFFLNAESDIAAGNVYTVLRPKGLIEDPNTEDAVGYLYHFVGNIKVDKYYEAGELYSAKVLENRLAVQREDIIVPFRSTKRKIASESDYGTPGGGHGSLVAFDLPDQRSAGRGSLVFVGAGKNSGLSEGQSIHIYQSFEMRQPYHFEDRVPREMRKSVGVLRIVDVTDAGAIGFVMRNSKDLFLGDRVGRD